MVFQILFMKKCKRNFYLIIFRLSLGTIGIGGWELQWDRLETAGTRNAADAE